MICKYADEYNSGEFECTAASLIEFENQERDLNQDGSVNIVMCKNPIEDVAPMNCIFGAEQETYLADFTPLILETVNKVIALADKHNIDRDNAMEHFATILKTMQEISTFSEHDDK